VSNSSGKIAVASVTSTELGYLSGKNSVVDGSGSANSVPKFSAANRLTNSIIFDNGTSVGIGLNNPDAEAKLHVDGTIQYNGVIQGQLKDLTLWQDRIEFDSGVSIDGYYAYLKYIRGTQVDINTSLSMRLGSAITFYGDDGDGGGVTSGYIDTVNNATGGLLIRGENPTTCSGNNPLTLTGWNKITDPADDDPMVRIVGQKGATATALGDSESIAVFANLNSDKVRFRGNGDIETVGKIGLSGGGITLSNVTSNNINFGTSGVAAPTFTNRSVGTKVVLWTSLSSAAVDYAIGIDGGTLWNSVPDATTSHKFKWFCGETERMSLLGTGQLQVRSNNGISNYAVDFTNENDSNFQVRISSAGAGDKGAMIGPSTPTFLAFMTNATERMRLDNSGNLAVNGSVFAANITTGTFTTTLTPNDGTGNYSDTIYWSRSGNIVTMEIPLMYSYDGNTIIQNRFLTGIPTALRPARVQKIPCYVFLSSTGYTSDRYTGNITLNTDGTFRLTSQPLAGGSISNSRYHGVERITITYCLV
jgi:hypothetical protein